MRAVKSKMFPACLEVGLAHLLPSHRSIPRSDAGLHVRHSGQHLRTCCCLVRAVSEGSGGPVTTRCLALTAVKSGSGECKKSSHINTKQITHAHRALTCWEFSAVGVGVARSRGFNPSAASGAPEERKMKKRETRLTCCTGHTSRSGGLRSSDTRHRWCTAGRPPQEPEPPGEGKSKSMDGSSQIHSDIYQITDYWSDPSEDHDDRAPPF